MQKLYFLFLIFSLTIISAQSKTNLELINSLIDTATEEIAGKLGSTDSEISLKVNSPAEIKFLQNRVNYSLKSKGLKAVTENDPAKLKLVFNLDNAATSYLQIIKDGILGKLLLERELIISGTYYLENDYKVENSAEFNYTVIDTVLLEDIKKLENSSLPFAKDELPSEPFFSGIIEPAVALGTAVVAVILFFTVRSN